MSTTPHRPFTAATDKFAFAQVFTRSTLPSYGTTSRPRRVHLHLPHRSRSTSRHAA